MRNRLALVAALSVLIPSALPAATAAEGAGPGGPPPLSLFRRGSNASGTEGITGPPPAAALRAAAASAGPPEAPPPKPPTHADMLDKLFVRLAKARDAEEAKGVVGLIERLWMQSGSDTADLLMERAVTALNGGRRDIAAALLDKLVELRPGWAEAWNKRATLRFLDGDDTGSMEDISHVLALEPRHFGALSGMGTILARHGEDASALKALRRALAVYPADDDVRKVVDKLAPRVEGQDL